MSGSRLQRGSAGADGTSQGSRASVLWRAIHSGYSTRRWNRERHSRQQGASRHGAGEGTATCGKAAIRVAHHKSFIEAWISQHDSRRHGKGDRTIRRSLTRSGGKGSDDGFHAAAQTRLLTILKECARTI